MVKIAIDASRANRKQRTGVEWYAFYVIQEMIRLADPSDHFLLYLQDELQGDWGQFGNHVHTQVLNWPPRYLWTHLRLAAQLYKDRPDCFFVPAHVLPLLHTKPVVMTIHDVAFKKFPQSYSAFENWYQDVSIRFALRHASKIIVPTCTTKEDLISLYGGSGENIEVIYHGIWVQDYSVELEHGQQLDMLRKYAITKPYFLFVGRIEEKKNLKRMLGAFERMRARGFDFQFVLIGKPGFGYEGIQQVIEASPYRGDIIQPGWVKQEHLPSLFGSAELFLYTTLYEGFGLPILEAFAAGTPVVTSNIGATAEVAGHAALLIDPYNIEDIESAILSILQDEQKKCSLIRLGTNRLNSFSWHTCAQKTYKVIRSLT